MRYSLSNPRTKARAFTLVEIVVATALTSAVGMVLYSSMLTTLKLSSQNTATNMSNYRSRQALDRIGEIVRFAQDTPELIRVDGTAATGSTADGLMIRNDQGNPYVFKNASGQADAEIPANATSFLVEFAPEAGVSAPGVGDHFSLALTTAPQLEVTSVGTVTGTPTASKVVISTRTALGTLAKPQFYTVHAKRYRKEAYIFAPANGRWELRHYPRVTATTDFASKASYKVLSGGFGKLGTEAFFTFGTNADGTRSVWMRAAARPSERADYVEGKTGNDTLTTMPFQVKLWNYNPPPPLEN